MKKMIVKLLLIVFIFIALNVFNFNYLGKPITREYPYYIIMAVVLSLAMGFIVNGMHIRSKGAIAIYGASMTLMGIVAGVFLQLQLCEYSGRNRKQ